MDLLRSCYRAPMRFFSESDQETTVQWYFVDQGTPFVPYPNSFVSCNWDTDPKGRLVIGDQADLGRTWVNGARPPGIPNPPARPCGTAEQWLNGDAQPPAVPVPLSPEGVPLCCLPPGAFGPFPFEPGLWFVAADIPGPQWASVGRWNNRADPTNPADQVDASKWPDKDLMLSILSPAVHFQAEDSLSLVKPFGGLTWTIWIAWYPGGRGGTVALTSPTGGPTIALATGSNIPLFLRLVGVSVGTLSVSPTVDASGFEFNAPVIARISYNGQFLTLNCYGDLVGSAIKAHIGQDYRFATVGPGLDASPDSPEQWIGEIVGWTRVLTTDEDAEVLARLTAAYVPPPPEDEMPIGAMVDWPTTTPPSGWLVCDGTDYAEADYPALVAVLGHTWDTFRGQSSPAVGRFRVPLWSGLVTVAAGSLATNPTTSARAVADQGGEETHQLTTPELASHMHGVNDPGHDHESPAGGNFVTDLSGTWLGSAGTDLGSSGSPLVGASPSGVTIQNEGGDSPHNNVQPFGVALRIIRAL